VGGNITHCKITRLGRFESCLLHHLRKVMSKGDKQRPTDQEKFSDGWDRIFGKKKEEQKQDKKKVLSELEMINRKVPQSFLI
jgi:hypothetical protein